MRHLIKTSLLLNHLNNKVNVWPLSCRFCQSFRKLSKKANDSTLNEEELNKFRSLNQIDWWTDPIFEGLRQMNELRVPFIRDSFNGRTDTSKPLNGIKLLEIGCGAGLLSEPLARLGANITAIDPIKENIEAALNHSQNDRSIGDNLKYESVSIEDLSTRDQMKQHFDGIIASEVLEHVDNVELFLSSGLKCLKKGGNLFITTISQTPIALIGAIFMAEYVLNIVPRGTHQYNKFITPEALSLILKDRKSSFDYLLFNS